MASTSSNSSGESANPDNDESEEPKVKNGHDKKQIPTQKRVSKKATNTTTSGAKNPERLLPESTKSRHVPMRTAKAKNVGQPDARGQINDGKEQPSSKAESLPATNSDGGKETVPTVRARQSRRVVFPEIDPSEILEVEKEGVLTKVHFIKGRKQFVPRNRKTKPPEDKFFPPNSNSLEMYGPLTENEVHAGKSKTTHKYEWRHMMEINPHGRIVHEQEKDYYLRMAKNMQQGCYSNCWMCIGLYLLVRNHSEKLKFLVVHGSCSDEHPYCTIRLRANNKWFTFSMDFLYAIQQYIESHKGKQSTRKATRKFAQLLGMQPFELDFLVPVLEKGGAWLHGSFKRLAGGFVSEGVSYYAESCGTFLHPFVLGRIGVAKTLFIALYEDQHPDSKQIVGLSTIDVETKTMKQNDLKKVHAYGVVKIYPTTFMDKALILVLIRDGHGVRLNSPINPKCSFFRHFGIEAQREIKEDIKEKGVLVVSSDVIFDNFSNLELIRFLPPKPSNFSNDPDERYSWEGYQFGLVEFLGSWKDGKGEAADVFTSDVEALAVFLLTMPDCRLQKKVSGYQAMSFTVTNYETGEELTTTGEPLNRFQIAVFFRTKERMRVNVNLKVENIHSISKYELLIYGIEGFPEGPEFPVQFQSTQGLDLLKKAFKEEDMKRAQQKQRTARAPRGASTSRAPSGHDREKLYPCLAAHTSLLGNLKLYEPDPPQD